MVSVVSNKLNGTEITTLPNYLEYKVSYDDDIDIAPKHLLASSTSEKYKVHVGYKKDISVSDIPATVQTLNLSFSVTYIQRDSNAVVKPEPYVYTVNKYDESATNPSRCSESGTGRSSLFRCSVSGLTAGSHAHGYVYAYDAGSSSCDVHYDGYSSCAWW